MKNGRVALLGSGRAAAGIAAACARAGLEVTRLEQDGVERGAAHLAGAGLVIEALPEDEETKIEILRAAAAVAGDGTVLATTTTVLSVTGLAARLPRPERVAGLRLFNPAAPTPLVEVVRALETSDSTVATLANFAGRIGAHPIVVRDRPGSLVNALLLPVLNQAIRELDEGLAAPADLDRAMELGLGHPRGPLQVLDDGGLDEHLAVTEAIHAATGDPRFVPPPLLRQMVAAGRLGSKAGRGFVPGLAR